MEYMRTSASINYGPITGSVDKELHEHVLTHGAYLKPQKTKRYAYCYNAWRTNQPLAHGDPGYCLQTSNSI